MTLPNTPPSEIVEDLHCLVAELTTLEEQELSDKDEIIASDLINKAIISSWSEGKTPDEKVSILAGKLQRLVIAPLNVITGYVIECDNGEICIRYSSEHMKFEDSKITLTV